MAIRRSIEAFAIDNIKDIQLPREISGLPLRPGQLQQLLENLPIFLTDPSLPERNLEIPYGDGETISINEQQLEIPYNDCVDGIGESPYVLRKPGDMHMRSFVIANEEIKQEWTDEYDNTYSAITLKGNNFSHPGIVSHPNASTGYIPYGLQESMVIERVLKASKILRENGISTEYIIGLAEPKLYPWPSARPTDETGASGVNQLDSHEMVSLKEYKRRIVEEHWDALPEELHTIEYLQELRDKFKDMTFYVSARAMDTEVRVADLPSLVASEGQDKSRNSYATLHIDNPENFDKYVDECLVPTLGENFARLHHLGLAHRFAHAGNLTALGGIVDLDSVHGEPLGLGDDPVTMKDKVADIATAMIGTWNVLSAMHVDRTGSFEGLNKNILMRFVVHYIDTAITLIDDPKKAKKYLGELLMELDRYKDRSEITEILWPSITTYAISIYLSFYTKTNVSDFISGCTETVESVHQQLDDPEMADTLRNEIIKAINDRSDIIIQSLAGEISTEYMEGEGVSVLAALVSSQSAGAHEIRREITRTVLETRLRDALGELYTKQLIEPGVITDPTDATLAWKFMDAFQKEGRNDSVNRLIRAMEGNLLVELFMELDNTLGYRIPENVLQSQAGSNLLAGHFKEKEFWIFTPRISIAAIDSQLKFDAMGYDIEELSKPPEDKKGKYRVCPSAEGYHVTQVVTDGMVQALEMVDDKDGGGMDFIFNEDEKPSYILVVQEDGQQNRQIHRYQDSEAMTEFVGIIADMVHSDQPYLYDQKVLDESTESSAF